MERLNNELTIRATLSALPQAFENEVRKLCLNGIHISPINICLATITRSIRRGSFDLYYCLYYLI